MTGTGGLRAQEVKIAREKYGSNALPTQPRRGFLPRVLAGFADPIIQILLIALVINALFLLRGAPWFETAGIAAAVFLATVVSALSEYSSDAAFEKMQQESAQTSVRVKRDGLLCMVSLEDIVCGDRVLLQAGERIPADGMVCDGEVSVDQSALTGESREVRRKPGQSSPSEQTALLFRGGVITSGQAEMEVTAVGAKTVYGGMAQQMQEDPRESPLHVRLDALATTVSKLGVAAAFLVAAADLIPSLILQGGMYDGTAVVLQDVLHAVTLAVTVLVVAVPEGLPMMITVVLSSNMLRMVRGHVLVRRLTGIETAGSMNVLFTDKTGTLTTGKMSAELFFTGDGMRLEGAAELKRRAPAVFAQVCDDCRYNSGASLSGSGAQGGNATDRALLNAVYGEVAGELAQPISHRIVFDSARKYAAVRLTNRARTLVRGAPELILEKCTQYLTAGGLPVPLDRRVTEHVLQEQSACGGRVLAMAITESIVEDTLPNGLILTALIVLRDPLRRETYGAVQNLRQAGIHVIMLTGDNIGTARAVAKRAGLLDGISGEIVESKQLAQWTDTELMRRLPQLRVVARAMPTDKTRLIQAAQCSGLVAGMTGDGVNDAPALRLSDVGFAMGSGTAVAKEAGDIVITDDNLASIARAVLYGRTIFKSIRKFLVFQLTINLCAVGVSMIGPILGIDTPVTVMQMLWINLIMDTLAGLAFSGEPPLKDYMKEAPKQREQAVLNAYMKGQIIWTGAYTVLLCSLFLGLPQVRAWFGYEEDSLQFLTAFFALFIFCGVFNACNARTHRLNLLAHMGSNPLFILIMSAITAVQLALIYFGGALFRTTPLNVSQLLVTALLAATVIPMDFSRKLWLAVRSKERDF